MAIIDHHTIEPTSSVPPSMKTLNLRMLPAKNKIHTVNIVYRERNVIIWCTLFNERYSLHKLAHHPKPNWVSEHKFKFYVFRILFVSRFSQFSVGREIVAQKME